MKPSPTSFCCSAVQIIACAFHLIIVAMSFPQVRAETFLVGQGQTNTITVAKEEVIIIRFENTNNPYRLFQNGDGVSIVRIGGGLAFAGPSSLLFERDSAVVSFARLRSTSFKTLIVGAVTNTL